MKNTSQKIDFSSFTIDRIIKDINILHLSFTVGCVLVIMVLTYTLGFDKLNFEVKNGLLLAGAASGFVGLAFLGNLLYKNRIASISSTDALTDKILKYRSAKILHFAIIEGPILLCAIGGFITHDYTFMVLALLIAIYFFTLRPSKEQLEADIPLKGNEKSFFKGGITLAEFENRLIES